MDKSPGNSKLKVPTDMLSKAGALYKVPVLLFERTRIVPENALVYGKLTKSQGLGLPVSNVRRSGVAPEVKPALRQNQLGCTRSRLDAARAGDSSLFEITVQPLDHEGCKTWKPDIRLRTLPQLDHGRILW